MLFRMLTWALCVCVWVGVCRPSIVSNQPPGTLNSWLFWTNLSFYPELVVVQAA